MRAASIVKQEAQALATPSWNREQVELIKRTVCPSDTTDDELKLFLHVAQTSGLDPLRKQIHCTKRQGRLTIIAGIDGLQARAARESDFEGLLHGVVCEKDEFELDATTGEVRRHTYNPFGQRGRIMGAWATVKRKGRLPFTATVRFEEYAQLSSPTWKQMPHVMIDKVARSTALRMAYPEQFSSVYEPAEMDQAGVVVSSEAPPPPLSKQMAATATPPASRTEQVKARLRSKVAPVPVEDAQTEAAPATAKAAPVVTPWERIRELGNFYRKTDAELRSTVKGATGKAKPSELTDDDVARVQDALQALAQLEPPPPGDNDAPF